MDKFFIAVLNSINRIGSKTVKKLVDFFGTAENVWKADSSQFQNIGVSQTALDNFFEFRCNNPDAVEKLIDFCNLKNIKICSFYDEEYPPILRKFSAAPIVFYYRGNLNPNAERIAIVGSRNSSSYGNFLSKIFASELSEADFPFIGAARGIDTFAHMAASRTVAVLGYGINKIPADKIKLIDSIIENGGVVMSDFPPNMGGSAKTFPARNRIIAGLSRGLIVVEADEKSGALIAANFAADNARDVFAVPNSKGCINLIRNGAISVSAPADVFKHYAEKSPA